MSLGAVASLKPPELRAALATYLLAVADDELILGHRHSEWTGFAPDIESDVALSSVAQEEIGHARLFYDLACELVGSDPDSLAYGRRPEEFRNAVLVERPNGDWGFTIVRMFLYDRADAARMAALAAGAVTPLAELARQLRREEKYHLMYGEQWLRRLVRATPESRTRGQKALDAAWPEALGVFESMEAEAAVMSAGAVQAAAREQLQAWREQVTPILEEVGLRVPATALASPAPGGRAGAHTEDLRTLLDEMTSVRRSEPGAKW